MVEELERLPGWPIINLCVTGLGTSLLISFSLNAFGFFEPLFWDFSIPKFTLNFELSMDLVLLYLLGPDVVSDAITKIELLLELDHLFLE